MFTWRGEENRPFLNLGKEWGKERYFPKQLWKQPRPWNFGEGAWTEGGTHFCIIPSPCCLWLSPCLHAVARKQIPIKSGLQGNETALWGKSYANPFLFNLMAKPRVSMILGYRRWVFEISWWHLGWQPVWPLRKQLCPSAPLFSNKAYVLHYLLEMPSRTSLTWGSLKQNETAQVEPKYLSKNSENVIGMWSLITPPAIRRSLGEHEMGRPEEHRDTESVPPRLDLQLNSPSLFLSDALSAGMPLQGRAIGSNLTCSRAKEQGASCGRHSASLSSLGY